MFFYTENLSKLCIPYADLYILQQVQNKNYKVLNLPLECTEDEVRYKLNNLRNQLIETFKIPIGTVVTNRLNLLYQDGYAVYMQDVVSECTFSHKSIILLEIKPHYYYIVDEGLPKLTPVYGKVK